MWQGDVETEARDKWGRGLFIALNVHLVMFAGVLLVPIVMLLSFQVPSATTAYASTHSVA